MEFDIKQLIRLICVIPRSINLKLGESSCSSLMLMDDRYVTDVCFSHQMYTDLTYFNKT